MPGYSCKVIRRADSLTVLPGGKLIIMSGAKVEGLPKQAAAVADAAGAAPTAVEFNALLSALRASGVIAPPAEAGD